MATRLAIAQPIKVGRHTLPNRIVMGSMHTGLEGHPARFDELARFYADRARGGAAMIVTGGFSPNFAGRMKDEPNIFDSADLIPAHRKITDAVHAHGGRILLQILHAGRYGYHSAIVAPSAIKSPINRDTPRELTSADIERTILDFGNCARLALQAGYDGIEIMGSEGYLISQFLASRTNHRMDEWGGALENRARFPLEVVKAAREAIGNQSILDYRISALELIEGGLNSDEICWLAKEIEKAGADCLSTGVGWHEATVPTIAGVVPHAAFAQSIARLKAAVTIPVTASNRINLPEVAERLVASNIADLVSMARPFLADADFVRKTIDGRDDLINICIACNQACLDHYFTGEIVTCLVNPRAVRELEYNDAPAGRLKKVAVVGAGVAGIACALEAAKRGHGVTLYDAAEDIGGQLRLAVPVPGKHDYGLALTGFKNQLRELRVEIKAGRRISAEYLLCENFDEVVIATGVVPRPLDIAGSNDPRIVGYAEILSGAVIAGDRVLVIGGGGIAHDVALFLAHRSPPAASEVAAFERHWGISGDRRPPPPSRQITMLKRTPGPFGRSLGKSTGWILRQELRDYKVRQWDGVTYLKIDNDGLHIEKDGTVEILPADNIVVCAGQMSECSLESALKEAGQSVHVVGGAKLAGELDAKRAIREGAWVGNRL